MQTSTLPPSLLLEPVPSLVSPPSVSPTESARHPALSVSWSPPQSDLPIQYYTISYLLTDSGPVTNITTTSISLLIANLKIGATYQVAVSARSALGEGPRSVWVHQTTHSREYTMSTSATCPFAYCIVHVIAFLYSSSRLVVLLFNSSRPSDSCYAVKRSEIRSAGSEGDLDCSPK